MSNPLNQNLTVYLASAYYKPMLDILMRKGKYKSRSDVICGILKYLFIREGLLDAVSLQPTRSALKTFKKLREVKKLLKSLKREVKGLTFVGLEEAVVRKTAPRI